MASAPFYDRVLETSLTTSTGTLTLTGAVAGYQSFGAIGNGNTTPMAIWEVDANGNPSGAWEVAVVCTYTVSGTTLTRGTFLASSTGSLINFGAGTKRVAQALPAAILNGLVYASQTYITGLLVTKNAGGNTLDISAGSCYDPSSQKIITYAGTTALSAGSLGASQWNQVYIYDNAGTVTIEVVNNADPPSTIYAGTARQGGTNSNRRWIGSFLTTSGSAIYAQDVKETGSGRAEVLYLNATNVTPFRVLSAGTQTSFTQVSLVGAVPRYVATAFFGTQYCNLGLAALANCTLTLSIDGTNSSGQLQGYAFVVGTGVSAWSWPPLEAATPSVYYKVSVPSPGAGPQGFLDVIGYRIAR